MILAATVVIVIAIVIVTVFAISYSRNRNKRSHLLNDGSMGTIMTHVVLESSTLTRTRTSASSESKLHCVTDKILFFFYLHVSRVSFGSF